MHMKCPNDLIELRSEKVRHIIGKIPPLLIRTGTIVITLVVMALMFVCYKWHYPICVEAKGEVVVRDTLYIYVPYKYLYLFKKPRTLAVTYEGEAVDAASHFYPATQYDRKLVKMGSANYFIVKAYIGTVSQCVQVGQKADVRILVSDKTLWEQAFHTR